MRRPMYRQATNASTATSATSGIVTVKIRHLLSKTWNPVPSKSLRIAVPPVLAAQPPCPATALAAYRRTAFCQGAAFAAMSVAIDGTIAGHQSHLLASYSAGVFPDSRRT